MMAKKRSFLRRIFSYVVARRTPIRPGAPSARPRLLRVEGLEPRSMLSSDTLVYAPTTAYQTWTTDQNVTDWTYQGTPTYWHQGDEADFPQLGSLGSQYTVDISGAGSQGLVYASKIVVTSGSNLSFAGPTSADQLEIPATGTTMEVDQNVGATTIATISATTV